VTAPSKYEERFTEWLKQEIASGGDVPRMVALVNSYQGADTTARYRVFLEWLENASLACGRCKTSFKPGIEDIQEEDQVLCVWCRKSWLGVGLEPVPGFRRTFAR
jgi:hypothetical protein